jgi:hypothetical protein
MSRCLMIQVILYNHRPYSYLYHLLGCSLRQRAQNGELHLIDFEKQHFMTLPGISNAVLLD